MVAAGTPQWIVGLQEDLADLVGAQTVGPSGRTFIGELFPMTMRDLCGEDGDASGAPIEPRSRLHTPHAYLVDQFLEVMSERGLAPLRVVDVRRRPLAHRSSRQR